MKLFWLGVILIFIFGGAAIWLYIEKQDRRKQLEELHSTATSVQLSDSQLAEMKELDSLFLDQKRRWNEIVEMRRGCLECHPYLGMPK